MHPLCIDYFPLMFIGFFSLTSPIMETFRGDGAITADLQMLLAFNLLLHVKWPDFEPFSCSISYT